MCIPYALSDIYDGLRDPMTFHNGLRDVNRSLNSRFFDNRRKSSSNALSEDWDTLIILDGCRYDIFQDNHTFDGDLRPVYSQGAHSNEFMQNTFAGQKLHDTVYITANPWSEQLADDTFFLTRTTYTESEQGGQARLPKDVSQLALDTFEEYPDKRYIVHFMQPNNPYIGPLAKQYRAELLEEKRVLCTELPTPGSENVTSVQDEVPHLRRALRKGYVSQDQMFEVYRENLEIVTEHAKKVLDELGGKTSITSDHGDMFGERLPPLYIKEFSHWEGVHTQILREVPWLEINSDERRHIESGEPRERERITDESVKDHLESMGYLSG